MAETDTFLFELVAPDRLLMSKRAAMVTAPGEQGDFGVLVRHAPMITTLRPGLIRIHADATEAPERIFVSGGFAEVTGDLCTVLCEEAMPLEEMDRVEVSNRLERAIHGMQDADTADQRTKAAKELDVAQTAMTIVEDRDRARRGDSANLG